MKTLLLLISLSLCGCAHQPVVTVDVVGSRIEQAGTYSEDTSRHITEIKSGTTTVDYKGSRALQYF